MSAVGETFLSPVKNITPPLKIFSFFLYFKRRHRSDNKNDWKRIERYYKGNIKKETKITQNKEKKSTIISYNCLLIGLGYVCCGAGSGEPDFLKEVLFQMKKLYIVI